MASSIAATQLETDGSVFAQTTIQLEPEEKVAQFINEFFNGMPQDFLGSFHIRSENKVALSGFRQLTTGSLLTLNGSPTAVESP